MPRVPSQSATKAAAIEAFAVEDGKSWAVVPLAGVVSIPRMTARRLAARAVVKFPLLNLLIAP